MRVQVTYLERSTPWATNGALIAREDLTPESRSVHCEIGDSDGNEKSLWGYDWCPHANFSYRWKRGGKLAGDDSDVEGFRTFAAWELKKQLVANGWEDGRLRFENVWLRLIRKGNTFSALWKMGIGDTARWMDFSLLWGGGANFNSPYGLRAVFDTDLPRELYVGMMIEPNEEGDVNVRKLVKFRNFSITVPVEILPGIAHHPPESRTAPSARGPSLFLDLLGRNVQAPDNSSDVRCSGVRIFPSAAVPQKEVSCR